MASKGDKTIPDLTNATPGFLLDEIARMRVETARLKFLDGVYKQALEARCTEEELAGKAIEGEKVFGSREMVTQERIDGDAVKAYFVDKPEELAKVMKVISFAQWKTINKVVPGS